MRAMMIAAVLAAACVTGSGCSVTAPRVAAAREQAKMAESLDRMSDELARQNTALDRIATALESAQPLLLPQARPYDQSNPYGATINPL